MADFTTIKLRRDVYYKLKEYMEEQRLAFKNRGLRITANRAIKKLLDEHERRKIVED